MRQALKLHPGSRSSAVAQIEVDIEPPAAGYLKLLYLVTGKIGDLRLPPLAAPARTDELWKHTCFEAFVRPAPSPAYYEFNFAPSTQWAAYRFSSYRTGMSVANEMAAPRIDVQSSPTRYELQAAVDLSGLRQDAVWHLALSAVIEEMSGDKSYWALAHPKGKADFHHSDCFALELARA
jgi:hypothetical protein